MTLNQEHFTTYNSLSPVLRTKTTCEPSYEFSVKLFMPAPY